METRLAAVSAASCALNEKRCIRLGMKIFSMSGGRLALCRTVSIEFTKGGRIPNRSMSTVETQFPLASDAIARDV
jgi:hypothetical protein